MAFVNAVPVVSSTRVSFAQCSVRPAFVGARSFAPAAAKVATVAPSKVAPRMEFEISEGVPYDLNPLVLFLAIVGWVVPSSIPTTIPLTEGTGLSQAFFASMNANLANWPKGPALDDPFWLLLVLWHTGLFACMIFGTIGYNIRKAKQ